MDNGIYTINFNKNILNGKAQTTNLLLSMQMVLLKVNNHFTINAGPKFRSLRF